MTDLLKDIGFSHDLAVLIAKSIGVFVVGGFGLLWTLLGIWIERKVAGRMQDRLGPNRVGPFGLIQSIADTVKILLKEDIMNSGVDRWVYNLAPVLSVFSVIALWAVMPFSNDWVGSDLGIAVLYLVAVGGLGTISVIMAGWGSNNKYALLAAFRAVAQLISYEVPLVLALLVPVMLSGSLSLQGIVQGQYIAYLFAIPLTWIIFIISAQAENGRGPFDLLEAESELVSGFHVEYSGMKFGMFYVAEFLHAFTMGVLFAVFFLGGWRIPFVSAEAMADTDGLWGFIVSLLGFFSLMIKALLAYFVLIWIRLTLPRLRIDQLLDFNWKFMVPLSLVNLLVVAFVWKVIPDTDSINSFGDAVVPTVALLVVNVMMIAGVLTVLRERARRERARVEGRLAPESAPDGVSTGEPVSAGAAD